MEESFCADIPSYKKVGSQVFEMQLVAICVGGMEVGYGRIDTDWIGANVEQICNHEGSSRKKQEMSKEVKHCGPNEQEVLCWLVVGK